MNDLLSHFEQGARTALICRTAEDARALSGLGLPAMRGPDEVTEKSVRFLEQLARAGIVVGPNTEDRDWGHDLAQLLVGKAQEVRSIALEKDPHEWVRAGGNYEGFMNIVKQAPVLKASLPTGSVAPRSGPIRASNGARPKTGIGRRKLPVRRVDKATCEQIARAALGEPMKRAGTELLWRCPNHEDQHPSLSINPKKDVFMCGPCGASGTAWHLAAFLSGHDPADRDAVKAWLYEHGFSNMPQSRKLKGGWGVISPRQHRNSATPQRSHP